MSYSELTKVKTLSPNTRQKTSGIEQQQQQCTNYKHENEMSSKLADLISVLKNDLNACDMKWTLFVAAAHSYRYDSQLKPAPAKFVEGNSLDIEKLLTIISQVPPLQTLLEHLCNSVEKCQSTDSSEQYNVDIIDLLHWIFIKVTEPSLKSTERNNVSTMNSFINKETFDIFYLFIFFF